MNSKLSISISRQFGSGGSSVGTALAKRLNSSYLDREIVMESAKKLGVDYKEIELFDERSAGFWESALYSCQMGDCGFTPMEFIPSDEGIHRIESEVILEHSKKNSMIVVGRGANFVLKSQPNHVSIFLHADEKIRTAHIMKLTGLPEKDALKLLRKTDTSRETYTQKYHGQNIYDLRHYHLVLDTGVLGIEQTVETILQYLTNRFGSESIQPLLNEGGASY